MTPGSPRDPRSQPAVPRERRTAGEERDEHDATLLLLLQLADTRSTATSYGHGSAVVLSFPHFGASATNSPFGFISDDIQIIALSFPLPQSVTRMLTLMVCAQLVIRL